MSDSEFATHDDLVDFARKIGDLSVEKNLVMVRLIANLLEILKNRELISHDDCDYILEQLQSDLAASKDPDRVKELFEPTLFPKLRSQRSR